MQSLVIAIDYYAIETMRITTHDLEITCLVIGGGPAGYGAAVAAQRAGCPVILAERHGFLGGMGTAAGLSCYLNYHFDEIDLSGAVYREFVQLQRERNHHYYDAQAKADFFEPESCKYTMECTFLKAGGTLLYHLLLTSVERVNDKWLVTFAHKGGTTRIRCRYLIDTTGDGDARELAGAEMTHGRRSDGLTQPMSMVVQLGGVDPQAWQQAGYRLVEGKYATEGDCFGKEVEKAREAGLWTIPRTEVALFWAMPSEPTRVTINGTRVNSLSACDALETTKAEIEGRRQADELLTFFRRYVPGFSQAYLIQTGPQIGVRESRRIIGRATLVEDDVHAGRLPFSSVTVCAYPIDVHCPEGSGTQFENLIKGQPYGIPWECLLPKGFDTLLAAGRCISATHEAAGSFRVMPTCMSLGEAAGTAVALAEKAQRSLVDLQGHEIRQEIGRALIAMGVASLDAILNFDTSSRLTVST